MNKKIWLSPPHMGDNELKYINDAFDSNWISPLGENVDCFEKQLENYLGNDSHVLALSSGTAAIHLGLILLDVKKGDEVICQSFTFAASAYPIVYLGAKPIFVGSEMDTWNICPESLETAILDRISKGKKPKAIIAVHLYGNPYKIDRIKSISNKYQIPILEDSAEALGSTYHKQKCGTFGDLGVLSFNGNKIITTSGGGALVLKSEVQKKKALFYATQARDNAPHYEHSEIGYNYRMSNICAGIGRGQMEVLDKHIALRLANKNFYKKLFYDIKGVNIFNVDDENCFSNSWLTTILIDPKLTKGISKENLRMTLASKNVEARPLWKPMHLQPVFSSCPYYGFKNSDKLFSDGLCLPSGSNLSDGDKKFIANIIKKEFNK